MGFFKTIKCFCDFFTAMTEKLLYTNLELNVLQVTTNILEFVKFLINSNR